MAYALGVDLGTTASAAAVGRDGSVEICALGDRSPTIPSVVVVGDDGRVLIGDAAARRAPAEPEAVAREFKRRFGDPTPFLLAGRSLTAEQLSGELLSFIVNRVRADQDEEPAVLALAHPAEYGPFKVDLLRSMASAITAADVVLVPEPIAAAMKHASESRIEVGALLAVYDFGGGTFDAAVVRRTSDGFDIVGVPGGLPDLGGADFDAAVVDHVDASLDGALSHLDPDEPSTLSALHRLRMECALAKEHLSHDTYTVIEVVLPSGARSVRLTRAEFEEMIRPDVERTIGVLERTIDRAGATMSDLEAVLLVGGSSRIPLVVQSVGARTGRPTLVDPYPKLAVAFGAAVLGLARLGPAAGAAVDVTVVEPPITEPTPATAVVVTPGPPAPGRRRRLLVAGLLLVVGSAIAAALFMTERDGDGDVATSGGSTTTGATSTSSTSTSTTSTTAPPPTVVSTAPPGTSPSATQVTAPPPPAIPLPRDLQVGPSAGSGELSVSWLADGPSVESYQSYLACGVAGNTAQPHRTIPNVEDISIAPEGRRGFVDFGACDFGTACYSIAARDAAGTEGPRSTPECGTP